VRDGVIRTLGYEVGRLSWELLRLPYNLRNHLKDSLSERRLMKVNLERKSNVTNKKGPEKGSKDPGGSKDSFFGTETFPQHETVAASASPVCRS
jgi:hypothetical protein